MKRSPILSVAAGFALIQGCAAQAPLRKVAEIPLPDAGRYDYQSLDPQSGLLYISAMGAGRIVVFDTKANKVLVSLPGYPTVTGVLAVPEEGKYYASATGAHDVVVTALGTSNRVLARLKGAEFPDGIAYVPKLRRVFVSDESGGIDLAIDARTSKVLKRIKLGGEAGNTQYDPAANLIWVAIQTKNEMAAIDPRTLKIVGRYKLAGSEHPHGFAINSPKHLAYISCDGNDRLLVTDLRSMKILQSLPVDDGPDVLVFDQVRQTLYVACESGAIDVFRAQGNRLKSDAVFRAPNAHTIGLDPRTHRLYVPLENVGGGPKLWVLEPTP